MTTSAPDDDTRARLAAPPTVPVDVDRFTSNDLFGTPGIYPTGTPMSPAVGDPPDEATARAALVDAGLHEAADAFAGADLTRRAPDPGPRAGLAALAGTIGSSLLSAFARGELPVRSVRLGAPQSPGRVVGPEVAGGDDGQRVVNARYQAEHPALLTPSLVHDLLWRGDTAGQIEECVLHALGAMAHAQLLARAPALASLGTELARRQNSLTITLLNSRRPGSPDISVVAPDGPGTIPGGAASMQTPDFWSVPFARDSPAVADAPRALVLVLEALLEPGTELPSPLRYAPELGVLLSTRLGRAWLPIDAQLVAARALGLVP